VPSPYVLTLFDHLIRPRQERGRNGETEGLGAFEVDDEFELAWLLDREIGGLGALEDLVDERCCATPEFYGVGTVRQEAARVDVRSCPIAAGQPRA
jgi:hypothetical protein